MFIRYLNDPNEENPLHFDPNAERIFQKNLKDPDFAQEVFKESILGENASEIRYLFNKRARIKVNSELFYGCGKQISALEYLVQKSLDSREISKYRYDPDRAKNRVEAIKFLVAKQAKTKTSYDFLNQKIHSLDSSEKENFETSEYYKDIISPVFELLKSN